MGRYKSADFLNPTIQIYFDLCMENLYDCDFEGVNADEINREEFRDLLVKYDLQDFTDWFLEYQIVWQYLKISFEEGREKKENRYNNSRPYALKVAKILKMFLTGEAWEYRGIEISAKYKREKIEIAGKDLIDQLKVGFITEFERLGLNETELTIEEAKEEVEDIVEGTWFEEYGCYTEDFLSDPLCLERYRLDRFRPREVSLEIVNKAISEIEMAQRISKKGVGAKVKNLGVGELAKRLSYLHIIRKFLNQKEYSSIKDVPLSNKTCRFIYDYLEFWGSLPEGVKFDIEEKENRANYIKSLIRNNDNYFKRDYSYSSVMDYMFFYDDNLEKKIDLFKKVKDGILTLSEYDESMRLI